jgi:hypothetical protein
MTPPTRPPRRPVTTLRAQPARARVAWQGLFQEAAYEDGQPYGRLTEPDGEEDADCLPR